MDHVQHARSFPRSGSHHGTKPSTAAPGPLLSTGSSGSSVDGVSLAPAGDDQPSGEPDSPGPRSPGYGNGATASSDLIFDQPLGAVAGFLLGLATLLVPLAGVITDRPLLPGDQESSEGRFRPVAVAESPGSRGPEKTAPDR